MTEKEYSPLSAACVRALQDKVYEKRKTAALEIERMVREFASVNNTVQIKKLLKILGQDFTNSPNPHARKGGLLGLASISIALGKDTAFYSDDIIYPIVGHFNDVDAQVKYHAGEALYNVAKAARGAILPHFSDIFCALSKLSTDSELNTKNGFEMVNRLMMDIVTENSSFNLDGFIPMLRERLYTKNSSARRFVISWISVLDKVPDIDLIVYLPELLDGLFKILDDPVLEVKKMCDTVLGEFLRSIKRDSSRVDFGSMINILITHAQKNNDEILQLTAITWIKEFVQLSGPLMLPYTSGIFEAVLPCLAYDVESRKMTDIKETATTVNHNLMKLVSLQVEKESRVAEGGDEEQIKDQLDLPSVVEVLTQQINYNSVQTKVAVLRWIHHLYIKLPNKMYNYIDILFPVLQRTLSDPADEVVQQCLVVVSEIISSHSGQKYDSNTVFYCNENPYYIKFFISLLTLFSADKHLLEERGTFIIRKLCVLLDAQDIYYTIAQILVDESNPKFASVMVETLNMILLTSSELFALRSKLKDLKTKESCNLFCCLYETWCHNPVATVALCLLAQCYKHACDLIRIFGSLEVTVEFLSEIDKLVQLIESPIFAYLRLELLDVPCDEDLVRALYGLLMLLPQSEAFHTLRARLDCIPSLHLQCAHGKNSLVASKQIPERMKYIKFPQLLEQFKKVQSSHQERKRSSQMKDSFNSPGELLNDI